MDIQLNSDRDYHSLKLAYRNVVQAMMKNPLYTNATEFKKALKENPFTAEAVRQLYDYADGACTTDEGCRWAETQFEALSEMTDYKPLAGRIVCKNGSLQNA